MSDDRLKLPPERTLGFFQRRKHDKWRQVEPPTPPLEVPIADSHAHIHMLPDPAWELVRCAANGVQLVCEICDPSEDDVDPASTLDEWLQQARDIAPDREPPRLLAACGVHPHNARLYTPVIEGRLIDCLKSSQVIGEIGLDFHYDLSPRETQRDVFRRQIRLAQDLDMPIALHLRGGEDPAADNAHAQALTILQEEEFPGERTLLHCCALSPDEIAPWIERGCYIAYGGALTFKNGEVAREGARLVPEDRLLVETDSPYMTPEPMRGAACTPAHVIFTAALLAELRGYTPGEERAVFLRKLTDNMLKWLSWK